VYSKLLVFHLFFIVLILCVAAVVTAQAQTPAPAVQAPTPAVATATLRGHVADQTGALIPGATVTVTTTAGTAVNTTTAESSGA
jgi:uncharacterized lipoprotein YbaY